MDAMLGSCHCKEVLDPYKLPISYLAGWCLVFDISSQYHDSSGKGEQASARIWLTTPCWFNRPEGMRKDSDL